MAKKKSAAQSRRAFGSILELPGRSGFYVRVPAMDDAGKAIMRTGPNGKPYQVRQTIRAGDTRADAEKLLGQLAEKAGVTRTDGPTLTLAEFADRVLLPLLTARASAGHANNVLAQLSHAARHFGERSMRSISRPDAQDYVAALGVRGLSDSRAEARKLFAAKIATKQGKTAAEVAVAVAAAAKEAEDETAEGLSPASIRRHVSALSVAWREAVSRGFAESNVWADLQLPRVQENERPYVSPEDVSRILAVLPASTRPLFVLAFNTGARLGELQGLAWSRVADDFSRVQFSKTKSGKVRDVYCTPAAREALRELHAARGPAPMDGPHLVFAALDRKTYLRHVKSACARLNLPELRVHDARHFAATSLVRAGVPATDVARVLGHANANLVLARYGHHAPENFAETAAAKLAQALGQTPAKGRKRARSA